MPIGGPVPRRSWVIWYTVPLKRVQHVIKAWDWVSCAVIVTLKRAHRMAFPAIQEAKSLKVTLSGGSMKEVQEWPWAAAIKFMKFAKQIVRTVTDEAKASGGVSKMEWQLPVVDAAGEPVLNDKGEQEMKVNMDLLIELATTIAGELSENDDLLLEAIDAAIVAPSTQAVDGKAELRQMLAGDVIKLLRAVFELNFKADSSLGNEVRDLLGTTSSGSSASVTPAPTSSQTPSPTAVSQPPTSAVPSQA